LCHESSTFRITEHGSNRICIYLTRGQIAAYYSSEWYAHIRQYQIALERHGLPEEPQKGWYRTSAEGTLNPAGGKTAPAFHWSSTADGTRERGWRTRHFAVVFPIWAALALFAIPGITLLLIVSRHRKIMELRRRAGRCLVCGYDLRASPDRCPECGNAEGSGTIPNP